jgi:hypothetical protein
VLKRGAISKDGWGKDNYCSDFSSAFSIHAETADRVVSVGSNCTGRCVFRCTIIARGNARLACVTSRTRRLMRSQPRSLLSIARLNKARSRTACAFWRKDPNGPDVLRFQRWFLADQLASESGAPIGAEPAEQSAMYWPEAPRSMARIVIGAALVPLGQRVAAPLLQAGVLGTEAAPGTDRSAGSFRRDMRPV